MSHTQSEIGKVLETSNGRARVEVSPSGLCSHCEMASSCIPASSGNRIIEVADPIGVAPSQRVRAGRAYDTAANDDHFTGHRPRPRDMKLEYS